MQKIQNITHQEMSLSIVKGLNDFMMFQKQK